MLPLQPFAPNPDAASEFQNQAQPASGNADTILNRLTEREVTVLRLVAKGFTNRDIAGRLEISQRTVDAHLGKILSKLCLRNRTQAALFALRWGIAPMP
jgi:DNA-binding NarL/FixJ family response regulator